MHESRDPIEESVHVYVDGAFNRQELEAQGLAACPAGVRVPVDAPDSVARDIEFAGAESPIYAHLAHPRNMGGAAAGADCCPREPGVSRAHQPCMPTGGAGCIGGDCAGSAEPAGRGAGVCRADAADGGVQPDDGGAAAERHDRRAGLLRRGRKSVGVGRGGTVLRNPADGGGAAADSRAGGGGFVGAAVAGWVQCGRGRRARLRE